MILAGGTAILVRSFLAQRTAEAEATPLARPAAPQKSVLVARGAIARGQILKPQDFSWQAMARRRASTELISNPEREPSSLWPVGWHATRSGQANQSPKRKLSRPAVAAFSPRYSAQACAPSPCLSRRPQVSPGLSFPGDRVDILITHQLPAVGGSGPEAEHKASETVLHDVRVIGVDQKLDSKIGEALVAHTATLEVTPKQSEIIAVATEMGKLSLSLRSLVDSPTDTSTADTAAGGDPGTFTLDSEVSQLLRKPRETAKGSLDVTVLRGSGRTG